MRTRRGDCNILKSDKARELGIFKHIISLNEGGTTGFFALGVLINPTYNPVQSTQHKIFTCKDKWVEKKD